MFSPKYLVFGAVLVSLLLAVLLISAQGAATNSNPRPPNPGSSTAPLQGGALAAHKGILHAIFEVNEQI